MNKKKMNLIIIGVMFSIFILLLIGTSFIKYKPYTVHTAICEHVTSHNIKTYTDTRICEIVIGEKTVDCFNGIFTRVMETNYTRVSYNNGDKEYIYIMFPEGEIRFYTLIDNIIDNNSIYGMEEIYEHKGNKILE